MTQNTGKALSQRLTFYGIDAHDKDFKRIGKSLAKHSDKALDRFYEKVGSTPETSHFFADRSAMDKAHGAQKQHWLQIFGDGLNEDYVARATRIGNVHAHIGLDPQWYIGGYAMILEQVIGKMLGGASTLLPGQSAKARAVAKLVKVALLDMDMALSTYFVKAEENVRTTVVNKIGVALEGISAGDLTARIEGLPESYGQLQNDFNTAMDRLRETIETVTEGAESISVGSSEIRTASDDLSSRTEQQAASLEESAAAMNQLTNAISETAQSILGLNVSVSQTHKEALNGGEVVRNAVAAMDDIQKSSDAIAQIIQIIDGIAFQTNLLALNAGVEAARVGEMGKGFAVVASEVRALAQRSTEAAEQIKQLISSSLDQVQNGVRLVNDAGKALDTIVEQVGGISAVATQIAASTETQSINLQQINHAVADMDKMTQQNAAMVEESTAAARAMAGEAERLSDTVATFKVNDGGSHARSAPSAKTRRGASAPAPRVQGNLAIAPDSDDWSEF